MVVSRNRPKGARFAPFGLCVLVLSGVPTQTAYQDLAALLVRQKDVVQRVRDHAIASPFGTIHAATFHFPRPVGTLIPEPPLLWRVSLHDGDVTGSLGAAGDGASRRVDYPKVNRRLKGDRLAAPRHPEPPPGSTRDRTPGRIKTVSFPRPEEMPDVRPAPEPGLPDGVETGPDRNPSAPDAMADDDTAPRDGNDWADDRAAGPDAAEEADAVTAAPQTYSVASLPPVPVELPEDDDEPMAPQADVPDPIDELDPAARAARLYFGDMPVGKNVGALQSWPGEQTLLIAPSAPDPDIKRSALAPSDADPDETPGQSIAPKGEVTGPTQRPKTPAERLGLDGKSRAKAEKCLANAVYFESRGEPKRGQIAVAQVVMNRVFSGYYPSDVCGVVYQNAHRYNACQFTFACDSVKDVVNDPPLWKQAMEIARDTLDGKLWLHDIGKSTHYHAYWVHPWWVGTMRKLTRIGVHTFYRPKRWGDGSDAPIWGPGVTAETGGGAKL